MKPISLPFYQNPSGKIAVHREVYQRIEDAIDIWLANEDAALWEMLTEIRKNMPIFLLTVLLFHILRERICPKEASFVHKEWVKLKKHLSMSLDMEELSLAEKQVIQRLFRNALFVGFAKSRSFSRSAALLQLDISQGDIDAVALFVDQEKQKWRNKEPSSILERLIQSELQREAPNFEGLLFPFLALQESKDCPEILRNVHSARSAAACWEEINAAQTEALEIIHFLDTIESTKDWSFGSTKEYYVVIALLSNVDRASFSWGKRHVIPFSSLLEALDFVWSRKPARALVTKKTLLYPNAPGCSDRILQEGIRIDEDVLLGYRTTEKVFLDGSYWSEKEILRKEEAPDQDQKQQQAKEELARLFLDMDELSSEDS